MTQTEFEAEFVSFIAHYGGKPKRDIIEFEWTMYRWFQDDMCREVGFQEYVVILAQDWLKSYFNRAK